ncbi:nitrous oxide reductase accessory protein NosL [Pareuzebyella sediminis]|uniref:nitrous oxide reductase accessory protein NosL n=1 Tax=Pareuzebyella sediminis TaxID=2607998 RepID=UPI0011EE501F|nr:nitrous oxide reductase accessory protein NosL [Pareuzebyella sediminis]
MIKNIITSIFFFGIILGCSRTPKLLEYGSEGCHYCKMTIVDKQHAAQFMTKKGRTYAFDATECMLNHLKEIDPETVDLFLVNDYNDPGNMIDATMATFLISRNIPSPMGEYLSAFATEEAAKKVQVEHGGELFSWTEINTRFNQ